MHLEHQDDKLPQALHNISVKLANINLALSKMHEVSKKNEMVKLYSIIFWVLQNLGTIIQLHFNKNILK